VTVVNDVVDVDFEQDDDEINDRLPLPLVIDDDVVRVTLINAPNDALIVSTDAF
jgi:hypothetical protein